MTKNHYALMLDLTDKLVLVVGGGPVAEWKIKQLIETGALLTVVSPEATPTIEAWSHSGKLTWSGRTFEKEDLQGCALVFAATSDSATNEQVCAEARALGVWVNNVEDAAQGDVIVPAQFRRGLLHMAVTTGGASPVLASEISQALQQTYGPEYEAFTTFLYKCRMWLNANIDDLNERRIRTNMILASHLLETIRQHGDYEAVQDQLWERITRREIGRA